MIIFLGDFNMNYSNKSFENTKFWLEQNGFKQLVNQPTHVENGLIDHVYLNHNHESQCIEAQIRHHTVYFSDHDALLVKLKVDK